MRAQVCQWIERTRESERALAACLELSLAGSAPTVGVEHKQRHCQEELVAPVLDLPGLPEHDLQSDEVFIMGDAKKPAGTLTACAAAL
jgi:hypothetical protein